MSPHSVLSSSMGQELYMPPYKATLSKSLTNLQLSSQRSTIKEVNHQSDSLVLENKKGIIISEKSVKSQLKLSSLITNVMSMVSYLPVVQILKTISTEPICSIQDSKLKSLTLLTFLMDSKTGLTRPYKNLQRHF